MRHDGEVTASQRDLAVDEFIELVAAVDGILQAQAKADARYFAATCGRAVGEAESRTVEAAFLRAYRWQYIHSGAQQPHFGKVVARLITDAQASASRRRSPRFDEPTRPRSQRQSVRASACRNQLLQLFLPVLDDDEARRRRARSNARHPDHEETLSVRRHIVVATSGALAGCR